MRGSVQDIEGRPVENGDCRRVLFYAGKNMQLVPMALRPGEEIGEEVHEDRDPFFRVEAGGGAIWIDGVKNRIEGDFAMIVPPGARHNVENTGPTALKPYTIHAPRKHARGMGRATKADAEGREEHLNGTTK